MKQKRTKHSKNNFAESQSFFIFTVFCLFQYIFRVHSQNTFGQPKKQNMYRTIFNLGKMKTHRNWPLNTLTMILETNPIDLSAIIRRNFINIKLD